MQIDPLAAMYLLSVRNRKNQLVALALNFARGQLTAVSVTANDMSSKAISCLHRYQDSPSTWLEVSEGRAA